MGIDYQAVFRKIQQQAPRMVERDNKLNLTRKEVSNSLDRLSFDAKDLAERIDKAKSNEKNLRCAQPTSEPFDLKVPAPNSDWKGSLIAADGSQIFPDKHQPELFGLINIGAIIIRRESGEAPELKYQTELLFGDELLKPEGYLITESSIELIRDLRERALLFEWSRKEIESGRQTLAWVDGPIELWGRSDGDQRAEFQSALSKYLGVLSQMAESGIIFAGYVDKPTANPITRMIEVAMAEEDQLQNIRSYYPLSGITDGWLFSSLENLRLPPGHRSAVFRLRSRSDEDYSGQFELHFFYLNVSFEKTHPQIARIEIPGWVAKNDNYLKILHGQLLEQCQVLGVKPYPYLLHRAHETAVVTIEDKAQVTSLIQQVMGINGMKLGVASNKQAAKDLKGRTKFVNQRGGK